MEEKTLYVIDLKNEWYDKDSQQMNNRNSLCYRIFNSEKVAREYMEKIIASVMDKECVDGYNPVIEEKRDKNGLLSISVYFNTGKDIIANADTHTTISARRITASDKMPEDPFDDAMSEIYIG